MRNVILKTKSIHAFRLQWPSLHHCTFKFLEMFTTFTLYTPTVPDAPRNVCTLLTYQKSDGDDPGQLAHIALDWTLVVHI